MNKIFSIEILMGGYILAPVGRILTELGFKNELIFLICLIVLLFLDTLTGVLKAIYHKNFSSRSLRNTPIKILLYICLILASFALAYYIHDISPTTGDWLKSGIFSSILLVEFVSITENIAMLSQVYLGKNVVPKYILKIMKDFDENGVYINPNNKNSNN
jgi:phage-related holin